ncbi:Cytochrome c-type biogenesis protein CcmH [Pseudomonas syringae pv. actinidiae]|nr:Cytochrome c-type biogenesis protein CcmH [Pseudomonas syringae pv. actinidiae]
MLNLLLCGVAHAAIDAYTFRDDAERARYSELTASCVAPNARIRTSPTPMRRLLPTCARNLPHAGRRQSNQQIIDFMVDRYGDFVRYKPSLNSRTWLLWFGPAGLLLGGLLVIGFIVMRRRKQRSAPAAVLSEDEQQRLARLLDDNRT